MIEWLRTCKRAWDRVQQRDDLILDACRWVNEFRFPTEAALSDKVPEDPDSHASKRLIDFGLMIADKHEQVWPEDPLCREQASARVLVIGALLLDPKAAELADLVDLAQLDWNADGERMLRCRDGARLMLEYRIEEELSKGEGTVADAIKLAVWVLAGEDQESPSVANPEADRDHAGGEAFVESGPVHKPGGWTRRELVEQAGINGAACRSTTFDSIRKAAGIPAAVKGGKGANRRYSCKQIRQLIAAAEQGPFRDGAKIAAAWGELLPAGFSMDGK